MSKVPSALEIHLKEAMTDLDSIHAGIDTLKREMGETKYAIKELKRQVQDLSTCE